MRESAWALPRGIATIGFGLLAAALTFPASAAAQPVSSECWKTTPGIGGIVELQPMDANVIKVARIAGSTASEPDEWEMHLDIWPCVSHYSSDYDVDSIRLDHLNAQGQIIRTRTPQVQGDTVVNALNSSPGNLMVREPASTNGNPEEGQFPYPLPAKVRITIELDEIGGSDTISIVRTFAVAEDRAPKGGYLPPVRNADLPDDRYWGAYYHPTNNQQRWALDIRGFRWDGAGWVETNPGATSPYADDEYVAFDRPVYAMADGEAIACNEGTPDDTNGAFAGGNHIWIRTGKLYHVYAHFREGSIPERLCPSDAEELQKLADPAQDLPQDKQYEVEAGDFLGVIGDTGNSSHPHTHIHVQRGLPTPWGNAYSEWGLPADGRPIPMFNTRVNPISAGDWTESEAGSTDPPATLPYDTVFQGDPCDQLIERPFYPEEPKIEIPSRCFPDAYNAMTYRGYRPVHIDVTEVGDTRSWSTIWRRSNEANWQFYYGLTEAQAAATIFGSNLKVVELESYRVGSSVRYALILVANPATPSQYTAIGETPAEFGQTYASQTAAGRWPVMMSVTEANDVAYITTVYQRAKVGSSFVNAGLTNFQQAFDTNAAAGRGMQWVESHVEDGQVRFAGIWYGKLTGPYAASGVRDYDGIVDDYVVHTNNGGFTKSLTAWHLNNQLNYRGLWRSPPLSEIKDGPEGPTDSDTAKFKFTLSDPFASAQCSLDGQAWQTCKSPKTYDGLENGNHNFRVRGIAREVIRGDASKRSWKVK